MLVLVVLGLVLIAGLPAAWAEDTAAPAATAPAVPWHPDAPPFTIAPRQGQFKDFPCTRCHKESSAKPPDPTPRRLRVRHPQLDHGGGQFWCMACHDLNDRNQLNTLSGQQVAFEEAYRVCGQCHAAQQKDWYFGAHGKRLTYWQGNREIYNCTHCHNPHAPAIQPSPPMPPPPIRSGLEQNVSRGRAPERLWERYPAGKPTQTPPTSNTDSRHDQP